ncbi:uncharacterized protein LACBIDRAFT_312994 [Laccaria bicolor S238N-H82]|uniref:Predicted protein n=1 Tax=Laccaria bicolor (strain S238N-H82 / ATCC MYA-4686) TaxID=486041 RepID=B0DXB1_LACBS|nr:uncharacterized protein LACBIDRAFT_312994 [Laccaria bicolor S238N-H82]EDR00804.1 predicted protein [Laccaria bicolor S238N-H82]|eukprot:XP_001888596.1 predicted protein [Laccaria bicolor S238N-H82]
MENNVTTVQTYKKMPLVEVPEAPHYITRFLPPTSNSLLLSHPSEPGKLSSPELLLPLLGSPFNELRCPSGSSSQPRLIEAPQDDAQKLASKFDRMEQLLKDSGFDSLGEFLKILFYNPSRVSGQPDPRGVCHAKSVARFLQGRNKVKISDIITLVYKHKHSAPSPSSPHASEHHAPFSPSVSPADFFYARPSLFTWATNLVANHVDREIYELAAKDDDVHLRASTNGRRPTDSISLVTWEALGRFSIAALVEKYKSHAPVAWHLTECMAASRKNGVVVVKKQQPHLIIQVGTISSFLLARNHFATGDLAMALGIWHFAIKSHIDVKRVYSRFGNIVSDSTVHKALDTMTGSSLSILREAVNDTTKWGETEWCLILDSDCHGFSNPCGLRVRVHLGKGMGLIFPTLTKPVPMAGVSGYP